MITLEHKQLHASQLSALYRFFEDQNEEVYKEQILDYAEKYRDGFVHICFCGHFSAGKSTLINRMMNQELLPRSPIPTSANIVEIKNGTEKAIIHFTNNEAKQFDSLPEEETLHALCQDGDEIKKIDLYKSMENLNEHVVIMDTPGIDAADDADRLMTESAIHKVDLFVYVMDYNHVQSEVNALFLKQLEERNKPYFVVVNQVDKHNEEEITFDTFKQSLVDVFHTWGIHPKDYFFTSMKDNKAPINEYSRLKDALTSFGLEFKEDLFHQSLFQSIDYSVQQSIQKKEQEISSKQRLLQQKIEQLGLSEKFSKDEVKKQLEELAIQIEDIDKQFESAIMPTIKNAQLMTFEHRERAGKFIESMQSSFKVGFFGSKKRTEEERENRLEQLYSQLQVSVSEQLEWRLREKASAFISEYYPFTVEDQLFSKLVTKKDMKDLVDASARYSNEYTLVYSDRLASLIRKQYRHYFLNLWKELRDKVLAPIKTEQKERKNVYELLLQKESFHHQINSLDLEMESYQSNIKEILSTSSPQTNESALLEELLQKTKEIERGEKAILPKHHLEEKTIEVIKTPKRLEKDAMSYERTLKDADQTLRTLESISSLTNVRKELMEKKNRLENRHYTVALFGAFSAGKSSFANLLIGERLLPVSPNPTTAAINKISPPSETFHHGDVYVTLKAEEDLLNDMQIITEKKFDNLADCYQWTEKTKLQKLGLDEQHLSFIKAFRSGYQAIKNKIGESFLIDSDQFVAYVQQEEKACFVQEIEVFYDCELTRHNITLVDTPGADSVNARHTDLAFSYIKDADAVLFVTYYNHPFSKPDQQFLERLGSVKDAFQLDKMFFIINAVDLANNEKEIELVQQYIQSELQTFHISDPRLYPLSSKEAFLQKQQGKSNERFHNFENDFYHFIQEELTQISMQSVYHDINRAFSYIGHLLEMLNSDEETKRKQTQVWNESEEAIMEISNEIDDDLYFERIVQRLHKQEHFMNQRFHIQFGDLFRSVVHPGSISSNGKLGRDELKKSLQLFNRKINERLVNELKALHIRMEQDMNEALKSLYESLNKEVEQGVKDFVFSPIDFISIKQEKIPRQLIEWEEEEIIKWSQLFKDTKSFFAEGRRDELQEIIYSNVKTSWEMAVSRLYHKFQALYQQEWNEINSDLKRKRKQEIAQHYHVLRESIAVNQSDKENYETIYQTLKSIVH